MSDSEHSTVTYTSVSEDDSDIGSPGVDGPPIMPEDPYAYIMAAYEVPPSPDYIPGPEVPPSPDYIPGPEGPPSPDYVPGPEEPEQAPPSPVYLPYPLHAATSPTAESPGYIPESDPEEDPEEDPADYPADRDDDDDDEEEEEHPALADFVPPVHRMTARISIRDEPSISLPPREEVERLLALTTPPPSPLTPLSSPLPHIPSPTPNSPTHIEIPKSCLPLRKRVRFASPTPSREVGESSAAGAARQDRPTISRDDPYSIAREDLYGFVDMVDVPPRCSTSRELDYDIMDTWDNLVGAIDEIAPTTVEGVNQRVTDLATIVERTTSMKLVTVTDQGDKGDSNYMTSDHKRQVQLTKTLRLLKGLQAQMVEFQRQHGPSKGPSQPDAPGDAGSSSLDLVMVSFVQKMAPKRKTTRLNPDATPTPVTDTHTTTSVTNAQIQAMINEGVTAALAARDATRNGDDSHIRTVQKASAHANAMEATNKDETDNNAKGEIKKLEFEMWNFEVKGHFKKDCPKLKNNNNRGNQAGNAKLKQRCMPWPIVGQNPTTMSSRGIEQTDSEEPLPTPGSMTMSTSSRVEIYSKIDTEQGITS
ncbi:hypothetical protein Tco_0682139 [Tanacetum coccineum]|uniref:Reverse transcriptase domain-containing protein n=1 Tax=Tanacetum coccineum TaxID=301880 RepID=A0ABQ4XQE5_9ASTR